MIRPSSGYKLVEDKNNIGTVGGYKPLFVSYDISDLLQDFCSTKPVLTIYSFVQINK
jgi:hypothetical protein